MTLAERYRRITPFRDRIATAIFMLGGLAWGMLLLARMVQRLRDDPQALWFAAALGALAVCGGCGWNLWRLLRRPRPETGA